MIRILVDSAADIELKELKEKNIDMAALNVLVGDKSFKDEYELQREKLYEYLLDGSYTLKTSQPSPQDYMDIFEDVKAKGDQMICLAVSSGISGTYQSACLACDMVDYEGIHVVDTLTATIGIKIMAEHALKLIAQNTPIEEIVAAMEELKGRIKIRAAIDTLKYLYLGGRVSKTTAVVADTVNIKPGITVTPEGEVGVTGKYLGVGRAVKDLVKQMKTASIDREHPVYMIYSQNDENAKKLRAALSKAGIEVDGLYQLGAALGVHVGPGAFGIIYAEKR